MSYRDDRAWSDRFLPIMRLLIGPHLLIPSSLEVDTQQASDLVVLRGRDMTIACRVRRHGYADRFPWDITIRAKRDTGARTELEKIVEGWADWMFYGHASEDHGAIDRWYLVDLSVWRREFIREGVRSALGRDLHRKRQLRPQSNGDGTHFVAFDVRQFPADLVIASSHDVPRSGEEAA